MTVRAMAKRAVAERKRRIDLERASVTVIRSNDKVNEDGYH